MILHILVSLLAGVAVVSLMYGLSVFRSEMYRKRGSFIHSRSLTSKPFKLIDSLSGDTESSLSRQDAKRLGDFVRQFSARGRKDRLRSSIEHHLPEFSETLLMGLRAGLSFDRAFCLYHERFDDDLAVLCSEAQQRWGSGLMSREESLELLAKEGDSELLRRVVTNINRSMKLGGSMSHTLEVLSSEARSCHKAKMEEKISKVAIKMMIPTALFILPSMLILVLGPVLLGMSY